MRIRIDKVLCQAYPLPYIKVTYDRFLNGDLEFMIGWFNRMVVISI